MRGGGRVRDWRWVGMAAVRVFCMLVCVVGRGQDGGDAAPLLLLSAALAPFMHSGKAR